MITTKEKNLTADVKAIESKPGFYKSSIKSDKKTSVIISSFANPDLVKIYIQILESKGLLKNTHLIIHKNRRGFINKNEKITEDGPTESMINALSKSNDQVILINDFVIPESDVWAEELANNLAQKHIHTLAPIIVRPDDNIEDAGIVINKNEKIKLFKGYPFGANTYFGNTDWSRNVDEQSGAILAVRKNEFIDFLEKIS